MKYFIYIDESGSINKYQKGIFSIGFLIVKQRHNHLLRNWFKREVQKYKRSLKVPIVEELKAHIFVEKNKKFCLYDFHKEIIKKYAKDYSVFVRNKNIKEKWLNNKNLTYNFMVKCGLERIFERENISFEDEIMLIADKRSLNTGSFYSLRDYLKIQFELNSPNEYDYSVSKISVEFLDSKFHWGVQMADFISWINYDEAQKNKRLDNKRLIY